MQPQKLFRGNKIFLAAKNDHALSKYAAPERRPRSEGSRGEMSHPAAAHRSVVVDGRAGGRSVVVGGRGANQRPLGFLLGAVGVVVLDDVVLSAEEGDDGYGGRPASPRAGSQDRENPLNTRVCSGQVAD